MIEFMWTIVLGNLFMFSMTVLIIGFMFVLRVALNLWFDTDFFRRICAWFRKADDRLNTRKCKKNREIEKQVEEAQKMLFIDREFED